MVEELRREREASSLSIPELTIFVDGGEFFSGKRREICRLTSCHACTQCSREGGSFEVLR